MYHKLLFNVNASALTFVKRAEIRRPWGLHAEAHTLHPSLYPELAVEFLCALVPLTEKQKHKNAQKAKEEINGKDISGKIIYEVGSRRKLNT